VSTATKHASRITELRPELRFLLAVAVPEWGPANQAAVDQLVAKPLLMDWSMFLDQAVRQQVVAMVGRNLAEHLPHDRVVVPQLWVYQAAYEANSRRNQLLFDQFGQILRKLQEHGVRYAVRKGPSLCSLVYSDPGIRRMSDLDLLVERECTAAVTEILTDLGYAQGTLSPDGRSVIPPERKTKLFWAVHLNNALPFLKPHPDRQVEACEVDLCLELFQKRSAGHVATSAILQRVRPATICGQPSYALNPLDQLLDLCLHLYKEANSYLSIAQGRDINLLRFLDLVESVRITASADLARLPGYARELSAERELYFALYHASLLYPGRVPVDLLDELRPVERDYLDEYGALEDRRRRWGQSFLDRLFNPRRWLELPGASTIPTV
jgi:Uncharacterised nucleotidyltransferase